MFERFTDRARRVVVLAQEEARGLNHPYIGTEHILLGLIQEREGVGAQALINNGVSLEVARDQVREVIGQGTGAPPDHIPFTPRAKKVLELSLREALQLGHDYIGTEHIVLGMLREGEGVAAQLLVRFGLTMDGLRGTVLELVPTSPERLEAAQEPHRPSEWPTPRLNPCRHDRSSLTYHPVEIPGSDNAPSLAANAVICSTCGATISVLPA